MLKVTHTGGSQGQGSAPTADGFAPLLPCPPEMEAGKAKEEGRKAGSI